MTAGMITGIMSGIGAVALLCILIHSFNKSRRESKELIKSLDKWIANIRAINHEIEILEAKQRNDAMTSNVISGDGWKKNVLQLQLRHALESKDYERAAEIRDQLKELYGEI